MFCSKCGSEIKEEGAMFCPNCGQRLQMGTQVPPISATKTNIKTGFKSKSKKEIAALAVAGVVVIVGVTGFSNRRTVIDMNDIYDVVEGGYDGFGTVRADFSPEKFMEEYKDKITLDKKSAKRWCKKEYSNADDEKEAYETLCDYDDVTSHFCDILEYCADIGTGENGKWKNGDVVEFVNENQDTFDTLEELYHCKFKKLKKHKVTTLSYMG